MNTNTITLVVNWTLVEWWTELANYFYDFSNPQLHVSTFSSSLGVKWQPSKVRVCQPKYSSYGPNYLALVPIADGSEDIETTSIVDTLRRANIDVTVASCAPDGRRLITMARGCRIEADASIDACASIKYDLIALPGGMPGAVHLRDCVPLIEMLKQQRKDGKWYGALCASPAVSLHPHGLLSPIATCYPAPPFHEAIGKGVGGDIAELRAVSLKQKVAIDPDWKCVTSMGPCTAIEFALELVGVLCGEKKQKEVGNAMLFNI